MYQDLILDGNELELKIKYCNVLHYVGCFEFILNGEIHKTSKIDLSGSSSILHTVYSLKNIIEITYNFALDYFGYIWNWDASQTSFDIRRYSYKLLRNIPLMKKIYHGPGLSIFAISRDDELWLVGYCTPKKIENIDNVSLIQIDNGIVFILCKNGDVYKYGTLLDRFNVKTFYKFQKVIFENYPVKIIDICSDKGNFLFLSSKGHVYSCGRNHVGCLGLGHRNSVEDPVRVYALPVIKQIYSVPLANIFVSVDNVILYSGEIYEFHPNSQIIPCIILDLKEKQIHSLVNCVIQLENGEIINLRHQTVEYYPKELLELSKDIFISNNSEYQLSLNKKSFVSISAISKMTKTKYF